MIAEGRTGFLAKNAPLLKESNTVPLVVVPSTKRRSYGRKSFCSIIVCLYYTFFKSNYLSFADFLSTNKQYMHFAMPPING